MPPCKTPGFELQHPLHENSFSITWKAVQKSLKRNVAIKFFKEETLAEPGRAAHILKVAHAVARLKHPSLVQIYDVVTSLHATYFIMECVEGAGGLSLLEKRGRLTQPQILGIARSLCAGMELAWTQTGLQHRNLKPSEIVLDLRGVPKLVDFSMAVIDPPKSLSETEGIIGTPNYLAPERIDPRFGPVDCRADLYSLGATLYHFATGIVPFAGLPPGQVLRAQLSETIENPHSIHPGITTELTRVLSRMMMKNPEDRYADWTQLQDALARVVHRKPIPEASTEPRGISTIAPAGAPKKIRILRGRRPPETLKRSLFSWRWFWIVLLAWLCLLGYYRWQGTTPEQATPPYDNTGRNSQR